MVKKLFFVGSLFLFASFSLFATENRLLMIPRETYIGDQTEIRYTMHFSEKQLEPLQQFFSMGDEQQENKYFFIEENPIFLDKNHNFFTLQEDNFKVIEASFLIKKTELTFVLQFYPLVAGKLDIPSIQLQDFFEGLVFDYEIDIPEVTISSILTKTGSGGIAGVKAPLVVPGTTYIIYGIILLAVFLFGLFIFLIATFHRYYPKVKLFLQKLFYSKHLKEALRKIKKMQKKLDSYTSLECAEFCSTVLKKYLEKHFSLPFLSCTPEELKTKLSSLYEGLENDAIITLWNDLYGIALRCDYVRFSGKITTAEDFSRKEQLQMLENLKKNLVLFEKNIFEEKNTETTNLLD